MHRPAPHTHPRSPPRLNPSYNHGVRAPRPNSHHSTLTFYTVTAPAATLSIGGPTSPSHGFCFPQPLPSHPSLRELVDCFWGADEGDLPALAHVVERGMVITGGQSGRHWWWLLSPKYEGWSSPVGWGTQAWHLGSSPALRMSGGSRAKSQRLPPTCPRNASV